MPLGQFANSVWQIMTNRHINRFQGMARHVRWQFRKLLNTFPVELRLSESRMLATHGRCGVSALVNSQGMYDYNNMNFVKLLLAGGGTFIDVGANVGSYSLVASEQERASVVAFEPHPVTFGLLACNISLNHRANITAVQAAVCEYDGSCLLSDMPGSALNRVVGFESRHGVNVPCHRLDSYCTTSGIRPDFVKIDTEGQEYPIIRSLGKCLGSVRVLILEMPCPVSIEGGEIAAFLNAKGFSGPYYCDFTGRQLRERPVSREDPLFIAGGEMGRIGALGFRFPV
jgi:FkbM family methyltransferase